MGALSKITPGQAAHDAWCAEDDWDQLDGEARDLWETAARAAIAAAPATRTARLQRAGNDTITEGES